MLRQVNIYDFSATFWTREEYGYYKLCFYVYTERLKYDL